MLLFGIALGVILTLFVFTVWIVVEEDKDTVKRKDKKEERK